MKQVKKLTAVLRAVGISLIVLAICLSIYSLATTGARWGEMSGKLNQVGQKTTILDRFRFDSTLFSAMADAAQNKTLTSAKRNELAADAFKFFTDAALKNEQQQASKKLDSAIAYFGTDFDYASYVQVYDALEGRAEEQMISKIVDSLDAMARPVTKTGKALPVAKKAESCKDALKAAYDALVAENGEETVGSYLEYAETVAAMLQARKDAGESISSVADALKTIAAEDYLTALEQTRAQEQKEAEADFMDRFYDLSVRAQNGEAVDFKAFFENEYASLSGKKPSVLSFVTAAKSLLESKSVFNDAALLSKVEEIAAQSEADSVTAFNGTFASGVVADADNRANISVISIFWKVVSYDWLMWLVGIALLIIAAVIEWAFARSVMKSIEKETVEDDPDVLLRVSHLKQYFRSGNYVNKAVDDVSFFIKKGEVFGLVGESGCGKTTTGRTIINLYDPTDGDVYFRGQRISSNLNGEKVLIAQLRKEFDDKVKELKKQKKEGKLTGAACAEQIREEKKQLSDKIEQAQVSALKSSVEKSRSDKLYRENQTKALNAEMEEEIRKTPESAGEIRARYQSRIQALKHESIMTKMQMIFQDPIASINPRMTVREIIAEGLIIRGVKDKEYINRKVDEMLELVGLVPEHADRYPHEFSGGQRQRIGIARAIIMEPDLIIADEPISALDVSIQAQVINLLNDLRNRMGLTIMFIAHNLSVVKYFSDRIAVMYYGKIVEMTTSDELFEHPLHPYTKSLLSAIPYPDPTYEKHRKRIEYKPDQVHDYSVDKPTLVEIRPGHFIYCNQKELEAYKKELGI